MVVIAPISLIIAAIIFVAAGLPGSCDGQKVTKEDVYQRISREVPLGSTKSHIISFVYALEINGHKAARGEYISPYSYNGRPQIKDYLGADISGLAFMVKPPRLMPKRAGMPGTTNSRREAHKRTELECHPTT